MCFRKVLDALWIETWRGLFRICSTVEFRRLFCRGYRWAIPTTEQPSKIPTYSGAHGEKSTIHNFCGVWFLGIVIDLRK